MASTWLEARPLNVRQDWLPTDGIRRAKGELQSESLVQVEWIRVHDLEVHSPCLQVVCCDERDAGCQGSL